MTAGLVAWVPESAAADLAPVTVMLDWLLNPNHTGLFAAQQSGAFARAGLAVKLISLSDPDLPCRLLAARQVDLAVSYGSQINMITSAGLPLLRMATLVDRPLNTIVVLGSVKTLLELKGKTIGYSVPGVEEAILNVMLGSAGLNAGDVTTVKVNYDMVAALLSRRLDEATVPLLTPDPGKLDEKRYTSFQNFCVSYKIIAKPQSLDQYATQIMA